MNKLHSSLENKGVYPKNLSGRASPSSHFQRKRQYLNDEERQRFIDAANSFDHDTRLFCLILAETGCRFADCWKLLPLQVENELARESFADLEANFRYPHHVRLPAHLVGDFIAHMKTRAIGEPIWKWSYATARRRVKAVMAAAKIDGPQANPMGLRLGHAAAMLNKLPAIADHHMRAANARSSLPTAST